MKAIKIKTQFEGFHRYKEAPEEVLFLREWHRHLFGVEAVFEVEDGNRELEFFIMKKEVDKILENYSGWENRFEYSCEQIAEKIFGLLEEFNTISVEISEDGENSGIYTI